MVSKIVWCSTSFRDKFAFCVSNSDFLNVFKPLKPEKIFWSTEIFLLSESELESDKNLAYHKQTGDTCTMSVLTALSLCLNKDDFQNLLKYLLETSFAKLEKAIATKTVEIKDPEFHEELQNFKVKLSEKLNAQC